MEIGNLTPLYTAEETRLLDKLTIESGVVSGYELMKKAGEFAFNSIIGRWPKLEKLHIVCGMGNNGGDGFVIASLAANSGISVALCYLGDLSKQTADARLAREDAQAKGVTLASYSAAFFNDATYVVDAIFGTGLERDVEGQWANVIHEINASQAKIVSIDLPSGLHADTGRILKNAVNAHLTITFIGIKQGMLTGAAKDLCGEIQFSDLDVPPAVFSKVSASSYLLPKNLSDEILKNRAKNSHKGVFGNLVLIGGAPGYNGAILLAAVAAMRAGCGLVTILTHSQHAAFLNMSYPEIMCQGYDDILSDQEEIKTVLSRADAIAIGPGLGKSKWADLLLKLVLSIQKPTVIDADALNLLPRQKISSTAMVNNGNPSATNWILTPHPGEASRLLNSDTKSIQENRFASAKNISEKYQAVCILKGAGSIIHGDNKNYVCAMGNPGMATAGMGDVLTGITGALLAQNKKRSMLDIAIDAVQLHAYSGDRCAEKLGEKGMIASDLIPEIRSAINGN